MIINPRGMLLPHIIRLRLLTFPDKWNVASSLKTILAAKFCFERNSKVYRELHCFGQLHVAKFDNYNFQIVIVSTEFFALFCVACLNVGKLTMLIYVDCERNPHEMYPPEILWLVVSRAFFLYKCSQSDQTIYTSHKSMVLLAVPLQTPYETSFAP
jgi:hypothetical protein